MTPRPRLSVFLPTFAAEDPGGWDHVFELARAARRCGCGPGRRLRSRRVRREPRCVRPARERWRGGRPATDGTRRALARAPDRAHRGGGADDAASPRHLRVARRPAAADCAGEAGGDARRHLPRARRPRRRHRVAARGVRRRRSRLRCARALARPLARGVPDVVARPACRATRRRSSPSTGSTPCPSPSNRAGCRSG